MAQRGSALVLVMSGITFISLIYLCVMRSSSFSYEIALARLEKKRQFYALRGLVDYGIAHCIANHHALSELYTMGTREIILTDRVPVRPSLSVPGTIAITSAQNSVMTVKASLEGTQATMSCVVSLIAQEESFYWSISAWQEI